MRNKRFLLIAIAVTAVILAGVAVRNLMTGKAVQVKPEGPKVEAEKGHEAQKVVKLHEEEMKEFGIEVKEGGQDKLTVYLELPGEITPNTDRLVHIVPRVPGVVRKVFKGLGEAVRAGETMAVIDSRELADIKAAYLAALKRVEIARVNLKREEELWRKKISPELDYLEAKRAFDEANIELRSAEQKLHALGFSEEYLASLLKQPDVAYTQYEIKAPISGTVIEKHTTLGEVLKDDTTAFVIADLSSVWVNISIYQKDMPFVNKGQSVIISAGGLIPDSKGVISYVSPISGEETRTAIARVVLPNPKGILRPGLFVTTRVVVDDVTVPLLIPKSALITEGEKTEVFVETPEGFKLKPITIGRSNDTHVEITSGMKPGEKYVSKGAFTLKAQLQKGAFGEGHGH